MLWFLFKIFGFFVFFFEFLNYTISICILIFAVLLKIFLEFRDDFLYLLKTYPLFSGSWADLQHCVTTAFAHQKTSEDPISFEVSIFFS